MARNSKIKFRSYVYEFNEDKYVYIHIPFGKGFFAEKVLVADLEESIPAHRTVGHVRAGKEGQSLSCANALAYCEEPGVLAAEFWDSRGFLIIKKNAKGKPTHALRGAHKEGPFQREFDKPGGKKKLLEGGTAEKDLLLTPPSKRKSVGSGKSHGGTSGTNGRAVKRPCVGAHLRWRRFLMAAANLTPET